jgi:hypothetical protein
MRNPPFILTVVALTLGVPLMCGHADEPDAVKALMKRKLENSQKILEGVALNDFDKIAKHADDLIMISKATDFKVFKTAQYDLYSNEFRRNAENLGQQAKAKSTDGAALAYVELTLTCVKCHKHVREVRMTRLD